MENYQKLEKIGEGKASTALSVNFLSQSHLQKSHKWKDTADSVSQVHTVSSTRLAISHILAE
jgi:hypothetical protein